MKPRRRATRQEIKEALRRRRHAPRPQHGPWRRSVLRGHYRLYGVPLHGPACAAFRPQDAVRDARPEAARAAKPEDANTAVSLGTHVVLAPPISPPYPWQRLRVTTEDKSRMRKRRTFGSVRGAACTGRPYRDHKTVYTMS